MKATELVTYLHGRESASADELMSEFGVSSRTIRLYIRRANEMLGGRAHIAFSRRHVGYVLTVDDLPAFNAWLDRMSAFDGSEAVTADKRIAYLMNDLLMRPDWTTVSNLATTLYVSPQSVSRDLKVVEDKLEDFGLTLEKKPRYGLRVSGPEMSRRLCLASIASEGLVGSHHFEDGSLSEVVKAVAACIEDALVDSPFFLSMIAFQNLVVHIVVAFCRIKENCLILLDDDTLGAVRRAPEYEAAQHIAGRLNEALHVELPDSEVAYIAIHLAGKKSLTGATPDAAAYGVDDDAPTADARDSSSGIVIPDEIWNVVSKMLDRVWDVFHFDFRNDLELRMNLARHLVPLVTRLRYNLSVDNPLLSDIKTKFPLAFAMADEASDIPAEYCGAQLSQEEKGYIALAFALALDRMRDGGPKRNVLVVCASGLGTARLLENAIRRQFDNRIDEIVLCDALHVASVDLSNIDYIFTTVPLPGEYPVPVQEVHSFLNEGDIRQIDELLNVAGGSDPRMNLFDEAWFEPHLDAGTPVEAIRTLAQIMVDQRAAPSNLLELAVAREEAASTAFGSRLALPHPMRALPGPTRICAGIAEQPIRWGDKDVDLVLLVVIGDDSRNALDWFFSRMADLLSHEERVRHIVDDRRYATLVAEIAHEEEGS